jgi:T4 RnlA family RNA ligase
MKEILKFNQYINESMVDNTHSYFVPSYEQCREICDANGNMLFYESKHVVDGFNISIFNYRLAQPANFDHPVEGNSILKAHELRGLTFVFNKDGSLYNRYLMLDKFWNMNQSPCSMYSIVKDYKIKSIYNKEDGSIASFIQLPNGRVLARSKTSFISDQAIEIQKIYDRWPNIKAFVDFCIGADIVPIFEYVAPTNRIVVAYANTDLILLRMRDNKTGKYLDLTDYTDKLDGITVAPSGNHSLDELIELKDVIEGKEGWIVQFENGKMIKLKTKWYCELHGLFTQELNRENTLISLIIDEKIDDIISQLGEESNKREEVDNISNLINKEIELIISKCDEMVGEFNQLLNIRLKHGGTKAHAVKDFAIKYSKTPIFPIAIGVVNGKDKLELIKDKIKNETKNLLMARKWLEKRGWVKPDTTGYKIGNVEK